MISFADVSFAYGAPRDGRLAVRELSFELASGEMLVVLGANGSGKSTLARLVNGLLLPQSGRVTVDGVDTRDEDRTFELRSSVGMVFQNPDDQIVATSVEDEVAFGPENLGLGREAIRARVDRSLADVGLTGLEQREPHLLSGGQKQRLAIAGALAMEPRYLVLDEPTAMIDSQGRREVLEVLARVRAEGRGIVLITHDVAEAVHADRVLVLSEGHAVFTGTPAELLACPELEESWGLEMPPLMRLAGALRELGMRAPFTPQSADELAGALWG